MTTQADALTVGCRRHIDSPDRACDGCLELVGVPDRVVSAVQRFGCRVAWVRFHWGPHRCLDDEWFESGCYITDPDQEATAVDLLHMDTVPNTRRHRLLAEESAYMEDEVREEQS